MTLLPLLSTFLAAASMAADSSDARFAESASAVIVETRRSQAAFARKTAYRPAGAGAEKGADRFSTGCRMDDDYAYGLVTNFSDQNSLKVDGPVYFSFYDKDGARIGNTRENGNKRVSHGRTEEVQKHYYPKGTASCFFEASDAVSWESEADSPAPRPSFTVDCSLRDGRAYGTVYNRGEDTLRVSGRAVYTFYEGDGDRLGTETGRVSLSVRRGERGSLGDVEAPGRASSCSIDLSGAAT